jgi:hypothetical protein
MAILVTEDVPCMMFLYFTARVTAKHVLLVYVCVYVYLCIYAVGGNNPNP